MAERVVLSVFSLRIRDSSSGGEVLRVNDQFDVDVHDAEALAEIEMLADLIVATSEHEGRLPQGRVDEILGVSPPGDTTEPDHQRTA